MKKINLYNNDNIKLQGMFYYHDSYKYWDLNHCSESFSTEYDHLIKNINKGYILGRNALHNQEMPMCVISLEDYNYAYSQYYEKLSSNIKRDCNLSHRKKFYFKSYNFNHNIEDFVEINYSQNKHRKINPWYLNKKDYFLNSHSGFKHSWEDELHYSQWYGIFKYYKHYKQGPITTNEKLFAYCKVAYDGEIASIHLIFGNRDNLKDGIMSHLLASIIEECFKKKQIKYIVYYSWHGPQTKWKSRFLFKPEKINYIL